MYTLCTRVICNPENVFQTRVVKRFCLDKSRGYAQVAELVVTRRLVVSSLNVSEPLAYIFVSLNYLYAVLITTYNFSVYFAVFYRVV